MMLPAKAAVLVICCLAMGKVRTKSTSDILNRELEELEEVLEALAEEKREESSDTLTGESVDVETRMSKKYTATVNALAKAKEQLEQEYIERRRYFEAGIDKRADGSSAASMAGLNDISHGNEGEEVENSTLIALFTARILIDDEVFKDIKQMQNNKDVQKAFRDELGPDKCDDKNRPELHLNCDSEKGAKFRTINGTCNNIDNPLWGSSHTPQTRLEPAEYEDGIDAVRTTGSNGKPLKSPRTLSNTVLRNESDIATPNDPDRSEMVMVWGQFLDHDITETPMTKGLYNSNVGCCSLNETERNKRKTQCATIEIPTGDHHFKVTCMDLVRSLPILENPCLPGVREQINAITAFLDGSQVYGSDEDVAKSIRDVDGLMKTDVANLLPANEDSACLLNQPSSPTTPHCFLAGDVRANENPHLSAMHIAFLRYHNILAKRLKNNAGLTDSELIYQTARKIIGAVMQHVTYDWWLPDVIGQKAMDKSKLTLTGTDSYDKDTNPSIFNEFSTSALRYGHSLVVDSLFQKDECFKTTHEDKLDTQFFRPDLVSDKGQLEDYVRSLFLTPGKLSDRFMVTSLHDTLFTESIAAANGAANGLDLSALNIQRGREHGQPGYVEYRKLCKLGNAKDFGDLKDHSPEAVELLKSVYDNVKDIDLFVGGLSENTVSDGHIGPTFGCLLATQFKNLKEGDRFFYERNSPEGMTEAQRNNIKAVPLAKILCEVFNLESIQENVFIIPRLNQLKSCSELQDIDVTLWRN